MIVATYGKINRNWLGIGVLKVCSWEAIWVTKPKNRHMIDASTGCQRPMITAARAMKPLPTVNSLVNEPVEASVKKDPPSRRTPRPPALLTNGSRGR